MGVGGRDVLVVESNEVGIVQQETLYGKLYKNLLRGHRSNIEYVGVLLP